jgi:hypothetical protein
MQLLTKAEVEETEEGSQDPRIGDTRTVLPPVDMQLINQLQASLSL